MILKELNLKNQSIHPYLKKRKDFFKSKDRLNRLKKWVTPGDREEDIELNLKCSLSSQGLNSQSYFQS